MKNMLLGALFIAVLLIMSDTAFAVGPTCTNSDTGASYSASYSCNMGEEIYCLAREVIMGPLMISFAIILAFVGLFRFLFKEDPKGLIIVIVATMIVLTPPLYEFFLGQLSVSVSGVDAYKSVSTYGSNACGRSSAFTPT